MSNRHVATRWWRSAFLGLCLVLAASPARADDTINPDRPSQSTGTAVVGPGVVQVETGVQVETFKGGAGPTLLQVPVELRFGTGANTEVSLTVPAFNAQGGFQGIGDDTLEMKWQVWHRSGPNGNTVLALIPNVTFPAGASLFRNAGAVEQVIVSLDVPCGRAGQLLTLNVTPTSLVDPGTGQRFTQWFSVATYGFNVTSTVGMFTEVAALGPDQPVDGITETSADVGITWLASKDTQWDGMVVKGLSLRGPDVLWTVGYSHRFGRR